MSQLTPGLIAAHSHRLEDLTSVAVNLMAKYPLAPLQQEVLLVQSNGIAQWLKIALAEQTGVASMLDVSLPARFIWRAYRAVLGDQIPRHSPYDKQRLRWRLMRLLPSIFDNPDDAEKFEALRRYTDNDSDQRKLFQLSDKLADLYDQYQVYRAEWLDSWAQGQDVIEHAGREVSVAEEHRWQPSLWRYLVADIGVEEISSNRAHLHHRFVEVASQLTERPRNLPPRVIVFGISSLPKQSLEVLDALKSVCQIVLCVHNPCQYFWADIVDGREFFRHNLRQRQPLKAGFVEQPAEDELHLHAHPLLASWGKQGRDYIRLLDEFDQTDSHRQSFADLRFDLFDETPPMHLLGQLQSDILNLRPVHETQAKWQQQVDDADFSICFHRCHSPQREVEVLHDQLLAAFANDPSLQPKDVMVMVPDVDQYAPHVAAVFGRLQRDDPRYIPFSIADQGARQRDPVLIGLELILSAPQQRFTHSDMFDLLHIPAVQQRFQLSAADVEQLQRWTAEAGARWGLNLAHREGLGMSSGFIENSWLFALQRMLAGYAVGEGALEPWQNIEPYNEVAGIQAQAVGGLAALLERLQEYWHLLRQPRRVDEWYPILLQLLDDFFLPQNDHDRLLVNRLYEALDTLQDSVEEAGFKDELRYNIVQEVWLEQIDASNLNQRFLAGTVNVATLMPMRAIPFKVVCLLGMNDADYPRSSQPTDFDLMVGHYQPGDRSRREDDRYLFLEAMLSARQQLYISWVGMSAQDNTDLPPSVLIGQLQDHLRNGWQAPKEADLIERLTTRHRLQPFARDYFNTNTYAMGTTFTFAHEWLGIHTNGHQNDFETTQGLAEQALPDYAVEAPFSVYALQWLLREPAQLFATQRLGVRLNDLSVEAFDDEVFDLNGLQNWQVKDEVVRQLLITKPVDHAACQRIVKDAFARMRRRGGLPLSHQAVLLEHELGQRIEDIFTQLQDYWHADYLYHAGQVSTLALGEFAVQIETDQLLYQPQHPEQAIQLMVKVSQIAHITQRTQRPVRRHLIDVWLRHVLAQAQYPQLAITTRVIGDGQQVSFAPLTAEQVQLRLTQLGLDLAAALRRPLPTALSLAEGMFSKGDELDLDSLWQTAIDSLQYLPRFYVSADALEAAGFVATTQQLYELFESDLEAASLASFAQA